MQRNDASGPGGSEDHSSYLLHSLVHVVKLRPQVGGGVSVVLGKRKN